MGNWVLVVEDNADSREALIELLSGSGFAAIGASTVQGALSVIAESPPTLVITDVVLGQGDGTKLSDLAQERLVIIDVRRAAGSATVT